MKATSYLLAILLPIAGCVSVRPLGTATLIVRPELGYHAQTVLNPYGSSDINHLTIKLFDTSEQDLGISRDLPNALIDNPIAFSNLKVNTTYRIRTFAYASAGTGMCISTNDSNCYVDISVGTDDRPTITTIPVKLINRTFDGQATSVISIISGGYSPISSESATLPKSVVTTLAGMPYTTGSSDGQGTAARFREPIGIITDPQGNVYVGDIYNNAIRKITPTGLVTTLATVSTPCAVAIDSSKNLYVAAIDDHTIRKVTPSGVVTILAGLSGSPGTINGIGTAAKFTSPYGITIDNASNIYVVERDNPVVRKITLGGTVTTFATGLTSPTGITADSSGNFYVADRGGHVIRKVASNGAVSVFAGVPGISGYSDGIGQGARFNSPSAVAVDPAGYVYVADGGNHTIRMITPGGQVTTLVGMTGATGWADGTETTARLNVPNGIALDATGDLWVADRINQVIRRVH